LIESFWHDTADCDGRTVGRSDGQTVRQTESIMAKTALCIASYADALSMSDGSQTASVLRLHIVSIKKQTGNRLIMKSKTKGMDSKDDVKLTLVKFEK